MTTIRERLVGALAGRESVVLAERDVQGLKDSIKALQYAYYEGPFILPPQELARQLSEYDASLLYDLVHDLQYDKIGALGYGVSGDADRNRAVDESRLAFRRDVLTQFVYWTWTNFGFGEQIQVIPEEAGAKAWWDEYWTADRNAPVLAADKLQGLSETVLKDGETFLAYFFAVDGRATVRQIDTKEIAEIITDPEDRAVPLWYKRMYLVGNVSKTVYYPDWMAFLSGEKLRTDLLPGDAVIAAGKLTRVCIQHVAHNLKEGMRGWPLMAVGLPWTRTHKRFREDRAAVAAAVAMFPNKLKVEGGSRAVDAMKARMTSALTSSNVYETNPPPVAGSTFVQNKAADLERMPLTSGAGDAKADGEALLLMAGLGGGIYPHWLGAGDAYRLATATSMEGPMLREFSRYRNFWSEQFRKMLRIVITGAGNKAGKAAEGNLREINTRAAVRRYRFTEAGKGNANGKSGEAEVSTDRLVEMDLKLVAESVASIYRDVLNPMLAADPATLDAYKRSTAAVTRLVLQALGVDDADEIASDQAFMVGVEPEPPEPAIPPDGQGGGDQNGNEPPEEEPEEAGMAETYWDNGIRKHKGCGGDVIQKWYAENHRKNHYYCALCSHKWLAESIDPDTGKVVPKGAPLPEWKGDENITAEDIKVATRDWNIKMGDDFAGMLDAPVKTEKDQE